MSTVVGNVKLQCGIWTVECEPHVRSRLKRVFPRAPQQAADVLRISATPENTRELEWFLVRYPMTVERPEEMSRLSGLHRDMELRIADLLAARHPPPRAALAEPAREYQEFASAMLEAREGLLLADDVGLGKTISALCAIVDPENLPAVVVVPAHMQLQWARQVARFAPHLSVHTLRSTKLYPLVTGAGEAQRELFPDRLPDVIITSYHKLRSWAETLAPIVRLVVFDECQQLRHPSSLIYAAADLVAARARRRLGLSATPIYNYGAEFFHVVDAIVPGGLGEYDEFVREWCKGSFGDKARIADAREFGAYLRREGIMLRRTRADVGRELPELTKVPHTIEADESELRKVDGTAAKLARIVLAAAERFQGERMQAAGEFNVLLRQATGIAKAPFVADFVRMLVDSGERVVLFGWHHEVYALWRERLKDLEPLSYTGAESNTQKDAAIADFIAGKSPVLIMSLRSGAGVDGLQGHCRTVVFGELDWSPGVHEQCVGRVHRDGQDEPVVAYFMVSESGADPIMADVLGVKREQIEGVRNPDSALAERVDIGQHHIRALAERYLQQRGERI